MTLEETPDHIIEGGAQRWVPRKFRSVRTAPVRGCGEFHDRSSSGTCRTVGLVCAAHQCEVRNFSVYSPTRSLLEIHSCPDSHVLAVIALAHQFLRAK